MGDDMHTMLNAVDVPCKVEESEASPVVFPWVVKFQKLCRETVGNKNMKVLEELVSVFIKHVASCIEECYNKKARASRLRKIIYESLTFFHMFYKEAKFDVDNTSYLNKMTVLVAFYLDMEIKLSTTSNNSLKKIGQHLTTTLYVFLDHSEDHMADTLLRTKLFTQANSELCCPVVAKLLKDATCFVPDEVTYLRCILTFKIWKRLESRPQIKKNLMKTAISKLNPPPIIVAKIKAMDVVKPHVKFMSNNITHYLLGPKFSFTSVRKEFLEKYSLGRTGQLNAPFSSHCLLDSNKDTCKKDDRGVGDDIGKLNLTPVGKKRTQLEMEEEVVEAGGEDDDDFEIIEVSRFNKTTEIVIIDSSSEDEEDVAVSSNRPSSQAKENSTARDTNAEISKDRRRGSCAWNTDTSFMDIPSSVKRKRNNNDEAEMARILGLYAQQLQDEPKPQAVEKDTKPGIKREELTKTILERDSERAPQRAQQITSKKQATDSSVNASEERSHVPCEVVIVDSEGEDDEAAPVSAACDVEQVKVESDVDDQSFRRDNRRIEQYIEGNTQDIRNLERKLDIFLASQRKEKEVGDEEKDWTKEFEEMLAARRKEAMKEVERKMDEYLEAEKKEKLRELEMKLEEKRKKAELAEAQAREKEKLWKELEAENKRKELEKQEAEKKEIERKNRERAEREEAQAKAAGRNVGDMRIRTMKQAADVNRGSSPEMGVADSTVHTTDPVVSCSPKHQVYEIHSNTSWDDVKDLPSSFTRRASTENISSTSNSSSSSSVPSFLQQVSNAHRTTSFQLARPYPGSKGVSSSGSGLEQSKPDLEHDSHKQMAQAQATQTDDTQPAAVAAVADVMPADSADDTQPAAVAPVADVMPADSADDTQPAAVAAVADVMPADSAEKRIKAASLQAKEPTLDDKGKESGDENESVTSDKVVKSFNVVKDCNLKTTTATEADTQADTQVQAIQSKLNISTPQVKIDLPPTTSTCESEPNLTGSSKSEDLILNEDMELCSMEDSMLEADVAETSKETSIDKTSEEPREVESSVVVQNAQHTQQLRPVPQSVPIIFKRVSEEPPPLRHRGRQPNATQTKVKSDSYKMDSSVMRVTDLRTFAAEPKPENYFVIQSSKPEQRPKQIEMKKVLRVPDEGKKMYLIPVKADKVVQDGVKCPVRLTSPSRHHTCNSPHLVFTTREGEAMKEGGAGRRPSVDAPREGVKNMTYIKMSGKPGQDSDVLGPSGPVVPNTETLYVINDSSHTQVSYIMSSANTDHVASPTESQSAEVQIKHHGFYSKQQTVLLTSSSALETATYYHAGASHVDTSVRAYDGENATDENVVLVSGNVYGGNSPRTAKALGVDYSLNQSEADREATELKAGAQALMCFKDPEHASFREMKLNSDPDRSQNVELTVSESGDHCRGALDMSKTVDKVMESLEGEISPLYYEPLDNCDADDQEFFGSQENELIVQMLLADDELPVPALESEANWQMEGGRHSQVPAKVGKSSPSETKNSEDTLVVGKKWRCEDSEDETRVATPSKPDSEPRWRTDSASLANVEMRFVSETDPRLRSCCSSMDSDLSNHSPSPSLPRTDPRCQKNLESLTNIQTMSDLFRKFSSGNNFDLTNLKDPVFDNGLQGLQGLPMGSDQMTELPESISACYNKCRVYAPASEPPAPSVLVTPHLEESREGRISSHQDKEVVAEPKIKQEPVKRRPGRPLGSTNKNRSNKRTREGHSGGLGDSKALQNWHHTRSIAQNVIALGEPLSPPNRPLSPPKSSVKKSRVVESRKRKGNVTRARGARHRI